MTNFNELGLNPVILKTVSELGFSEATPIQEKGIPIVLDGRDIMGLAQTGTGKTAAFGLPLIQNLMDEDIRPNSKSFRALILAPTRELAGQISDNLRTYVRGTRLRVEMVTGGVSIRTQFRKLAPGVDILVATPGRLIDLADRGALKLDQANFLVLDEADQMLDLGFIHSLRQIAKLLNPKRQTLLFSATMPKQIADLSRTYLKDPVRVETAPAGKAADKIDQCVHFVSGGAKLELLKQCLKEKPDSVSVVFARTKHGAEKLMKNLVASGFKAGSVHGNKSQGQRDRAIKAFRSGELSVLVATDVAARGIDIPGVTHVYNYNLPEVPENYVHRIGRTGRAGADGQAIAFCAPDEMKLLRAIEKVMKMEITCAGGQRPAKGERVPEGDNKRKPRGNKPSNHRGRNKSYGEQSEGRSSRSKGGQNKQTEGNKKPKRHWSEAKNGQKRKGPKQKAANQNNWKGSRIAS